MFVRSKSFKHAFVTLFTFNSLKSFKDNWEKRECRVTFSTNDDVKGIVSGYNTERFKF